MRRRVPNPRPKGEPTIALINVVFLMLVFFLVAGNLTPPLDDDITLVSIDDLEGRQPPNALMVHADGRLSWRGEFLDAEALVLPEEALETPGQIRLVPDRELPAGQLMQVAAALQAYGIEEIFIVTERGLE